MDIGENAVKIWVSDKAHSRESRQKEKAGERMLYAKYSIDFAIRAAQNALQAALAAIEAEMEYEKWRNTYE